MCNQLGGVARDSSIAMATAWHVKCIQQAWFHCVRIGGKCYVTRVIWIESKGKKII